MPERIVPCEKCDEVKRYLEAGGFWKVTGCASIKHKPGFCRLVYKKR